jgi:DNA-binding LacI/PurR family transcriptional regulator
MRQATTIGDIAKAVGVSVSTVSNALNGKANVGRAMRQQILRVARELYYRPNRAAKALRTGQNLTIGLVLPDLTNPFFPELTQSVESTARKAGLLVCLIDSHGSTQGESDGFELLSQHAVDGIIWCPLGQNAPAALEAYTRPVILIDRPRAGYDVVHSDYLMGGRLLAEYAHRKGHSRIVLISGPRNTESARLRRDGFLNGLHKDSKVCWDLHVPFDGQLTEGAVAALKDRGEATLVVCGNDMIAISAMHYLSEMGLKVPDHVSVTGFDNIKWTEVVIPRLTTVAQPVGALGVKAVELLRARMNSADGVRRRALLGVRLIERDSVKDLNAGRGRLL